jgi:hypothetical protein
MQHVVIAAWLDGHWADIGTIVSILIAFVAAFRPELHSLLRPRKIDIILTDSFFVEIGFDAFGSTIGIVGAFDNEHSKSVISKLRLCLTIPDLASEYVLSPVYNRVRKFSSAFAGGGDMQSTLWLPFLIRDDVVIQFDVLFRSDKANAALTTIAYDLRKVWEQHVADNAKANKSELTDPDPSVQNAKIAAFRKNLFTASQNVPFMQQAVAAFEELFVWRSGKYRAVLEVEVRDCKRVFSKAFNFSVSDEDRQRLAYNIGTIVAAICLPEAPSAEIQIAISQMEIAD